MTDEELQKAKRIDPVVDAQKMLKQVHTGFTLPLPRRPLPAGPKMSKPSWKRGRPRKKDAQGTFRDSV